MWPVLVLGILTAIFAWIWYGGSGDAKEPQAPVQKEETQPESVEPEQRLLPAAATKLQDIRLADADTNITHDSIREPPTDLPRKGELQADIQEPPTDLPRKGELQADIQEPPTDLPRKGELQADIQENPTDAPNKDHQANILEKHTCLLEEHLENHKEITSKNDEVDAHPSDIPEAREVPYIGDQVYPPLKKEVQPEEERPHNVGTAVLRANGEVTCPALMAEEPGAQKLLGGPCRGSVSQHKKGHPVNDSLDGVCANGEVNGAKQTAENAADHPLEDSLLVEENVMNVSESKEPLNQALFLQMVNKSIEDAYAVVADQLKHESVEKCDIKRESTCSDTLKSSTSLQDHISSPEGLSNVQKFGASPESSPVDICNLLSNQENEMASFCSSNSDEKTSFGGPSEASVHETDHLKTRQVATIHPMSQNVNFAFKVHYITHSDSQVIGITGDHEKLGKWETYVPLTSVNGGFWSHSITLPSDTNVAWKLVMVENGKIQRWEECNNRFLKTSHEDIEDQLSWGYP